MPEVHDYASGSFCWAELVTSDGAAAKRFYGELFGWNGTDNPIGGGAFYTMLRLGGRNVAALYQMDGGQKARGVAPHWNLYVAVADIKETAGRVEPLGGQLVVAPFAVMEEGRMARLKDPTGAELCIWQPKRSIGAQVIKEPGAMCWSELSTPDDEAAGDFYTSLFGWGRKAQDMGTMIYTVFLRGEEEVAGMYATGPTLPAPTQWLVYFQVADCDASLRQAESLGGQVMMPATAVPGVGRFAIFGDPQGAPFAILEHA